MTKKKASTTQYHDMESKQYHNYEHVFNFDEEKAKSQELVRAHGDLAETNAERKIEMDRFNQRSKEIVKNIDRLCNELREGKEQRNGECVVKYSADLTHVYVLHPDTGSVIFDRDLDMVEQSEVKDAWDAMQKKAKKGKKAKPYVPPFLLPPAPEPKKETTVVEENDGNGAENGKNEQN